MKALGLVAAAAMLLGTGAQAAQMYRWVDENGRVHYGDRPPPGKHEKLRSRAANTADADEAPAEISEACAELERRLASYRDAEILVEQDAEGNKRQYNEQEKQQLVARTTAARDRVCNPD